MNIEEISKLVELAKACNLRRLESDGLLVHTPWTDDGRPMRWPVANCKHREYAEYFAAASPPVIIGLAAMLDDANARAAHFMPMDTAPIGVKVFVTDGEIVVPMKLLPGDGFHHHEPIGFIGHDSEGGLKTSPFTGWMTIPEMPK